MGEEMGYHRIAYAIMFCLTPIVSPLVWADIRYVPAEYPTIQAAIDASKNGDVVLVAPGTYAGEGNRDIDFKGKAITVKSENGPESCIIQCGGVSPYSGAPHRTDPEHHRGFYFHSHEDVNSVVQGFTVTQGYMGYYDGGAFYCMDSSPCIRDCIIVGNAAGDGGGISAYRSDIQVVNCVIKANTAIGTHSRGGGINVSEGDSKLLHCLIAGNAAGREGGGIHCSDGKHQILNCTVSGNRTWRSGRGGGISIGHGSSDEFCRLYNSIVWGNSAGREGDDIELGYAGVLFVMPLNVANSLIGEDPNDIFDPFGQVFGEWLMADPLFVRDGYRDPSHTVDHPIEGFWMDGDFHLKSQGGHWDQFTETWVKDDVTSPCIDTGVPWYYLGFEPFPNGGIINMGAYGGTNQASKSYFNGPPCETIIAGDINGDCRVDFVDLALLTNHWLETGPPMRRIKVTDVGIMACEIVGGRYRLREEMDRIRVGDSFSIMITLTNYGTQVERFLNCYSWDLSPDDRLRVIGLPNGSCTTLIELHPRESCVLRPFATDHAFQALQVGSATMTIPLRDHNGDLLETYRFAFEVLPLSQGVVEPVSEHQ